MGQEILMTKIIQLTAQNVKRLSAVQITPSGNLVILGGKNGQGKSSVLDAIAMALGGAGEFPPMPVRRGEDRASVILDLGDIIVKRTFLAHGGETTSTLIVETKDKMRASAPQAILDRLTGKVTFDPLAFINMEADRQALTLRRLVGLDFSALDAARQKLYSERTLLNRDNDRDGARVDLMPRYSDCPPDEQSAADIVAELEAASANNRSFEILSNEVADARKRVEQAKTFIVAIDRDIAETEARLVKLRDARKASQEKLDAETAAQEKQIERASSCALVDTAPIKQRLATAEAVNAKIRANKAHAEAMRALVAARAKAALITSQIADIDREKDKKLAALQFPVAGLSFDKATGGVVFNGVPFEQASDAEKLRVSVAIAAALNPKLRVMLVRGGSDLDEDNLKNLARLAEEFDLQVWLERVSIGAECSVIIEDGAVKADCATQ